MNNRIAQFLIGFFGLILTSICFAQSDPTDVGTLIHNIQTTILVPLLNVVVSISYLAGAGFVVAAIFKFKAHKDNPQQVTIGAPIMMLFVGIGLLLFPSLVTTITKSIGFTSGTGSASFSGSGVI